MSVNACFEEMLAVDSHEWHFSRAGSCGENDVFGFVIDAIDIQMAPRRKPSESLDQLDSVFVEQEPDAFRHRLGDFARPCDDLFQIGSNFSRKFYSVAGGGGTIGIDLCAFQQGFRRNTPPVEADAPGFRPFDKGDFFA